MKADYDTYSILANVSLKTLDNKMMADKTKVSYADAVKQLNEALLGPAMPM